MDSRLEKKKVIRAEEVANYAVCPEAWRLKYVEREPTRPADRRDTGRARREEWIASQDLSAKLRSYAKIAYLLLVLLAIVVFLLEHQRTRPSSRGRPVPGQAAPGDPE